MMSFLLWMFCLLLCVEEAVSEGLLSALGGGGAGGEDRGECNEKCSYYPFCARQEENRRVDLASGACEDELGEAEEDDCCQNSQFGYKKTDGVCRYCGPPVWSPWSSWGACSVLCGEGVRQQSRKCFGGSRPECPDSSNTLQTEPCNATLCCPGVGQWGAWGPWELCSVECGGAGVRRRGRNCSHVEPSCSNSCQGSTVETEVCNTQQRCPVHGAWSIWSKWGECSASCIQRQPNGDIIYPSRARHRSCSNPAPSADTLPPGNSCPGDGNEVQDCSELPNCPVDGSWGSWEVPGPCSVSCGEGLQLSFRRCDSPAPKYEGKLCSGPSTRTTVCENTCPVHGDWSGWSSWGECSTACISQDSSSIRKRYRACTNPTPSSDPPGNSCPGDASQTDICDHLPHCPVDGVWGLWGPWSSCPVTCGIGQQLSIRKCDSPAPKHGGTLCEGPERRSMICTTNTHCPVDGVWSEWSAWGDCHSRVSDREMRCKMYPGSQRRQRHCLHRAHNGTICPGNSLTEARGCYDVSQCYLKGTWAGWSEWSLCKPSCGGNPRRYRIRICQPDVSAYSPTIGRQKEPANFHGKPLADCGLLPEGEGKHEIQPCLNVPPCPDND